MDPIIEPNIEPNIETNIEYNIEPNIEPNIKSPYSSMSLMLEWCSKLDHYETEPYY